MQPPGLKRPLLTIALCLAVVAIHLGLKTPEALAYGPGLTPPWTLVTAHLVHWSLEHLIFDGLGFLWLGSWCEMNGRASYVCFLGLGALAIPPLAVLGTPEIELYAGLSGLVMGLAILGVFGTLRRLPARGAMVEKSICLALAAVVVAKLMYELCFGQVLFVDTVDSGFLPVPVAHLVGVVLGALVAGCRGWAVLGPHQILGHKRQRTCWT